MMKNRYFITYGLLIAGLLSFWGCSKQSSVVPPSGSTISMPADVTVTGGVEYTIHAMVQDQDGNPMNGVAVVFMSTDSTVASFSKTSSVFKTSASTDNFGIATIVVYTFSGVTGVAEITGDILVTTKSMKLTVQ